MVLLLLLICRPKITKNSLCPLCPDFTPVLVILGIINILIFSYMLKRGVKSGQTGQKWAKSAQKGLVCIYKNHPAINQAFRFMYIHK
jgi:hypothetical protein